MIVVTTVLLTCGFSHLLARFAFTTSSIFANAPCASTGRRKLRIAI